MKWKLKEGVVDQETVESYGRLIGIKLPEDYIHLVQHNDGARPEFKCFDMENEKEAVFNSLLSYISTDEQTIVEKYDTVKDNLPSENILPFANDPFGNLICFDYRNTKENPQIVFWDHESSNDDDALTYIAEDFKTLINNLYEPE